MRKQIITSEHWPEATEGRIPTKNKSGFMFVDINGISPEFIQNASKCTDMIVDIGCAYGIISLPALHQSHCKVVAFDLSSEHLAILHLSVPQEEANRFTTKQGRFPDDFNFDSNSVDAIHSSHMFHFLDSMDTEKGLYKCFQALKPGGKIYINTVSIYFNLFKGVLPLYEEKSARGSQYPGEIFNFGDYLPEKDILYAPNFIHAHKINDFERFLVNAGFTMDKIFYYDLPKPAWYASEGKGFIGAIATKPKTARENP